MRKFLLKGLCLFIVIVYACVFTSTGYADSGTQYLPPRATLAAHMVSNGKDLLAPDTRSWTAQFQSYSSIMKETRLDHHNDIVRSWQTADDEAKMAVVRDYVGSWLDDEGISMSDMKFVMNEPERTITGIKNGTTILGQGSQEAVIASLKKLCTRPTPRERLYIVREALTDLFLCTGQSLGTLLNAMNFSEHGADTTTLLFRIQCLLAGEDIIALYPTLLSSDEQRSLVEYIDTVLIEEGYSTDAERSLDKRVIPDGQGDFVRFIHRVRLGNLMSKERIAKETVMSEKAVKWTLERKSTKLSLQERSAVMEQIKAYLDKTMHKEEEDITIRAMLRDLHERGGTDGMIAEATNNTITDDMVNHMRFGRRHVLAGEGQMFKNAIKIVTLCLDEQILTLLELKACKSADHAKAKERKEQVDALREMYGRIAALPVVQAALESKGVHARSSVSDEIADGEAGLELAQGMAETEENYAAVVAAQSDLYTAVRREAQRRRVEAQGKELLSEIEAAYRTTLAYVINNDIFAINAITEITGLYKQSIKRLINDAGDVPTPDRCFVILYMIEQEYAMKNELQRARDEAQALLFMSRGQEVYDIDILRSTDGRIKSKTLSALREGKNCRAPLADVRLLIAAVTYEIARKGGDERDIQETYEALQTQLRGHTVSLVRAKPVDTDVRLATLSEAIEREKEELSMLDKAYKYVMEKESEIMAAGIDDTAAHSVAIAIKALYEMGIPQYTLRADNVINETQLNNIIETGGDKDLEKSARDAVLAFDTIAATLKERVSDMERRYAAHVIVHALITRGMSGMEMETLSSGVIKSWRAYAFIEGRGTASAEELNALKALLRDTTSGDGTIEIPESRVPGADERAVRMRSMAAGFLKDMMSLTWQYKEQPMTKMVLEKKVSFQHAMVVADNDRHYSVDLFLPSGAVYELVISDPERPEGALNEKWYQAILLLKALAARKEIKTVIWDYERADIITTEIIDMLHYLGCISIEKKENKNGRFIEVVAKIDRLTIKNVLNGTGELPEESLAEQSVYQAA
jgi:hypothetical protein